MLCVVCNLNYLFPTWMSFTSLPPLCRGHINSSYISAWQMEEPMLKNIMICRRQKEKEKMRVRCKSWGRWRRLTGSVKSPSALTCAVHGKSSWFFHLASLSTTPHSTWAVFPLFPAIGPSIWPDGGNRCLQHSVTAHSACRVAAIKSSVQWLPLVTSY